jgi:hypothetical protein
MILLLLACSGDPESPTETADSSTDTQVQDTQVYDTGPPVSYNGPAYEPCVSDAQCGPGSACDQVPGFAGSYCAPPCDGDGDGSECDLDGTLGIETLCLDNGRCAQVCSDDPTVCPTTLECQELNSLDESLCAGEPFGQAGPYGTCTHPNVAGTDCPPESDCFGGDYIGVDEGSCLPWCDDGSCPGAPDGVEGASPLCYDAGLEHPVCVLLCTPDESICPDGQECLNLYSNVGLCVPEGGTSPL